VVREFSCSYIGGQQGVEFKYQHMLT
jgi:hypothetical protein